MANTVAHYILYKANGKADSYVNPTSWADSYSIQDEMYVIVICGLHIRRKMAKEIDSTREREHSITNSTIHSLPPPCLYLLLSSTLCNKNSKYVITQKRKLNAPTVLYIDVHYCSIATDVD